MNDETGIKNFFEFELEGVPNLTPPAERIRAIAETGALRPIRKLETLVGLAVTFGYVAYMINPLNWFSFGRFMFAMVNGFSLGRFVFVFNIGL